MRNESGETEKFGGLGEGAFWILLEKTLHCPVRSDAVAVFEPAEGAGGADRLVAKVLALC
jgi:hypothetical protein